MAAQTVRITKVFADQKTSKKTGKPFTKYSGLDAGGNRYTTIDARLGQRLQDFEGQTVTIEYEEVDWGGASPDLQIKSISTSNGASQVTGSVNTGGGEPRASQEDDRQIRIMRQSGLERAIIGAQLGLYEVNSVDDLFQVSDAFIDYFVNGVPVGAERL